MLYCLLLIDLTLNNSSNISSASTRPVFDLIGFSQLICNFSNRVSVSTSIKKLVEISYSLELSCLLEHSCLLDLSCLFDLSILPGLTCLLEISCFLEISCSFESLFEC